MSDFIRNYELFVKCSPRETIEGALRFKDATINDLKARYEALEAENATIRQDKWISVKNELPADGQTIAFIVQSKDSPTYSYLDGEVMGGRFHYLAGQATFSVPGIGFSASHWMPLPTPPTEKE